MVYKNILVTLENSETDEVILGHIKPLARLANSKLLLLHVADGFVARHQELLDLHDSEEIQKDRDYLETQCERLRQDGFEARSRLECGDPPAEILRVAEEECCELIAMATHGHGPMADFILGSVAEAVRHRTDIPLLLVKDPRRK
jgi:nucleotide-binding universal stress UspA family protein